ncbi:MBOAT family O-acyltransferase [Brevibacillus dissolubilis]|uniref:MBOAT family O-acyltransferase n=1 Tax=Brevibacillus dissolubilis TaxID=1844116 RepID=UPI00111674A4|nr:MBOAT family protein [Brevibacillus dissolubilis]
MVFSNLVFLYLFLPAIIALYYIVPKSLKNTMLLLASLLFYAWGEPIYVFLMLGTIVVNYACGLWLHSSPSEKGRKGVLTIAILANLGILGFYKYAAFFATNINNLLNTHIPVPAIALPIGISFFTFHAMSYIIDVYRRHVPPQRNVFDLTLYFSFFPQLVAGPIIRYHEVAEQFQHRTHTREKFVSGIERFLLGLSKKVLLANPLGAIADEIFALSAGDLSSATAWIGIAAYTMQIYFDFSGYSDMAIGLAKMFGFEFQENFRFPYISRSVSEFWRRWHISLGSWFRDYVYIPLGGNRVVPWKAYRNLLVVWTLTGFWHGASWTFMAWGFYYGILISLEKAGLEKRLAGWWRPLQHVYVLLAVMIGWVFFRADDFGHSMAYLGAMFGGASAWVDGQARVLLSDNLWILLIGVVLCAPVYDRLRLSLWVKTPMLLTYLLICTMYLVNSTYNPFIYFRF